MSEELNILMLEDVDRDAELVNHELARSGLAYRFRHVAAGDEFFRELRQNPPDVILSDHGLASFDGFTVLALVRERCPDIPFIFVTGHLSDEQTVRAFELGAADCVLKHRLSELGPAVTRAVREANARRQQRERVAALERENRELKDALAQVKTLRGIVSICSSCKKIRNEQGIWANLEDYLEAHSEAMFSHGVCPDCARQFYGKLADAAETKT